MFRTLANYGDPQRGEIIARERLREKTSRLGRGLREKIERPLSDSFVTVPNGMIWEGASKQCTRKESLSSEQLRGWAKVSFSGLMNCVPAVAYRICLNLRAAFSQLGMVI